MSRFVAAFAVLLFLVGCQKKSLLKSHDDALQIQQKDYERLLLEALKQQPKPVQKKKVAPPKPPTVMLKKVSLQSSEAVPVKTLLLQIARDAGVNIAIDPTIVGSLHYQAVGEPFVDALNAICELTGLRYQLKHKTVVIEPDEPYTQTYELQFPLLSRENKNKISTTTDVFTAMEGYNREFDNGSSTILSIQGKTNFWEELEQNVKQIILFETGKKEQVSYTINKQAGLISINAPFAIQKQVKNYLNQVHENCQQQVLIEAKILEVNLSREYQSGINWYSLNKAFKASSPMGTLAKPGAFNADTFSDRNVMSLGVVGKSLSVLSHFLNKFGTVRTLSSPRLTVMNNQSAVLKVATNFVFFKINYSREFIRLDNKNNSQDLERASSQIQTVPIGLVMTVHPTVDKGSGRITLAVRPTISRVTSEKEDPAVAILSKQEKVSKVPEIQIREMDSVLHMDSGETIIMGGLMQEGSQNTTNGVPVAQDIPLVGSAFGGREDKGTITELVIFLRATLLERPEIHINDKHLYNVFAKDPRSLSFN